LITANAPNEEPDEESYKHPHSERHQECSP
jgi:hypothetical protein